MQVKPPALHHSACSWLHFIFLAATAKTPDWSHTWTALVQEDTASWARPANTLASTQRYSFERHSSVCCTGGYQLAYALGELSFCRRHTVLQSVVRGQHKLAATCKNSGTQQQQASRSQHLTSYYAPSAPTHANCPPSQHLLYLL